jgi:hypothetical protein
MPVICPACQFFLIRRTGAWRVAQKTRAPDPRGPATRRKAAPNALAITKETLAPLDAKERETLLLLLSKLR